ncbi:hypothetical protein ABPG72_020138 [Tetrahymena utriculariae]
MDSAYSNSLLATGAYNYMTFFYQLTQDVPSDQVVILQNQYFEACKDVTKEFNFNDFKNNFEDEIDFQEACYEHYYTIYEQQICDFSDYQRQSLMFRKMQYIAEIDIPNIIPIIQITDFQKLQQFWEQDQKILPQSSKLDQQNSPFKSCEIKSEEKEVSNYNLKTPKLNLYLEQENSNNIFSTTINQYEIEKQISNRQNHQLIENQLIINYQLNQTNNNQIELIRISNQKRQEEDQLNRIDDTKKSTNNEIQRNNKLKITNNDQNEFILSKRSKYKLDIKDEGWDHSLKNEENELILQPSLTKQYYPLSSIWKKIM